MAADLIAAARVRLRQIEYAERVTRILCWRSGPVEGFEPFGRRGCRSPPLPFHSKIHKGGGFCRVCGQPIYGGGSFRSFAGAQSKRLTWHTICTTAYFVMTKPANFVAPLLIRQAEKCAISGEAIPLPYSKIVDVDHELPLYRVARERSADPWCELIRFWMTGNLRVITRAAHVIKSAEEAKERSRWRQPSAGREAMELP